MAEASSPNQRLGKGAHGGGKGQRASAQGNLAHSTQPVYPTPLPAAMPLPSGSAESTRVPSARRRDVDILV